MQNFVSGYNSETKTFTLISLGTVGKPNVEEFENVLALDLKIEELERKGHIIHTAPALHQPLWSEQRGW